MKKINFTKMVGSGNDFVVIEGPKSGVKDYKLLARDVCDRKFGVGANGLLVLDKSKRADVRMRIFNADGSEAEMCGNGARCIALYVVRPQTEIKIETKAGIIEAKVSKDNVKIRLTNPKEIKIDFPIKVNGRNIKVNFINTGVPHTVVFVEGLDKFDVTNIGRQIRYHKAFTPKGANVNFVEIVDNDTINVRTYERGVEDETLACGTGSVASALVYSLRSTVYGLNKVNVHTKSGEILKVYFKNDLSDVWLEGGVKITYKGEYNV